MINGIVLSLIVLCWFAIVTSLVGGGKWAIIDTLGRNSDPPCKNIVYSKSFLFSFEQLNISQYTDNYR